MTLSSSAINTTYPHLVLRRIPVRPKVLPQLITTLVCRKIGCLPTVAAELLQVCRSSGANLSLNKEFAGRLSSAKSHFAHPVELQSLQALRYDCQKLTPPTSAALICLLCLQPHNSQKPDDPVEAALKKVNEAVNTAEKQLEKLDKLPSAQMPRQVRLNAAFFSPARVAKPTLNVFHSYLHHLCVELQTQRQPFPKYLW